MNKENILKMLKEENIWYYADSVYKYQVVRDYRPALLIYKDRFIVRYQDEEPESYIELTDKEAFRIIKLIIALYHGLLIVSVDCI